MVITYKEKTLEVDYTVLNPISMIDKEVYYYYDEGRASYSMVYLDRSAGVMYVGNMHGSTVSEAVTDFLENYVGDESRAISILESIVDGTRIASGVTGEGTDYEQWITAIPSEDGNIISVTYVIGGETQVVYTMTLYIPAE